MTLRARLIARGWIPASSGFALVSATCDACGCAQHLLVSHGSLARCIECQRVLGGGYRPNARKYAMQTPASHSFSASNHDQRGKRRPSSSNF